MPEQNNNSPRRRRQQPVDNTYAHVQPQATEIERAVLGALMIDKDAYAMVCEMLTPESFYEPRNQKVYRAIMELSLHESPVDVWTVTEQLARQGDLEDVGIERFLARGLGHYDVFKVPHHGKKESNSAALIEAVQPRIAVITDSPDDPAAGKVLKSLEQVSADIYQTSLEGTIRVTSAGNGQYSVETDSTTSFR